MAGRGRGRGRGRAQQAANRPPTPQDDYPALPSAAGPLQMPLQYAQAAANQGVPAAPTPPANHPPSQPQNLSLSGQAGRSGGDLRPAAASGQNPAQHPQTTASQVGVAVSALKSAHQLSQHLPSPSPSGQTGRPGGEVGKPIGTLQIARQGHTADCVSIPLVSNMFPIILPEGFVYHYDVEVNSLSKSVADGVPNEKQTRCTSTAVNRKVIATLAQTYKKEFNKCLPAYDGRKNMYVRRELPVKDKVFLVEVTDNEAKRQFAVQVKLVGMVSFDPLHAMYNKQGSSDTFQSAIAAADIILRTGPSLTHASVGRSFFSDPGQAAVDLGGGCEAWSGFYSSIRLGDWKPLVNIDMSTTAFYKKISVIDFAKETLGERCLQRGLSDRDRRDLQKDLCGLRVTHVHVNPKRTYKIERLSQRGANAETFECEGKRVSVADYFYKKYRVALQYPHLPCIVEHNGSMLPMEMCRIAPAQHCRKKLSERQTSTLIRSTAIEPRFRFEKIKRAAASTRSAAETYFKEFDMKIGEAPVEVMGRILRAPRIACARTNTPVAPFDGVWKTKQFDVPAKLQNWALAIHDGRLKDTESVIATLMNQARNVGMQPSRPVYVNTFPPNCSEREMLETIKNAVQVDIVVVVLGNSTNYSVLKMEAETSDLCMRTQCVKQNNINFKFSNTFADNLLLKINSKCGGKNWKITTEDRPHRLKQPYMVVGADVNHSAPGDNSTPSVAALVASTDPTATQFFTTTSVQMKSAEKNRIEYIVALQAMFGQCLTAFRNVTRGHLPKIVYFYRDGVSEGQLETVRYYELSALRAACLEVHAEYRPQITFIVVQKRHHVRFKPKDDRQGTTRNRNMPAGTVIDQGVVHKVFADFYLCSQQGPMGTSVPAHYHIVHDDADHTLEELEKLSYFLCYMYARCSKAVSIPAPVFYAHLAAKRAKEYIKAKVYGRSSNVSTSSFDSGFSLEDFAAAQRVCQGLKGQMYFL